MNTPEIFRHHMFGELPVIVVGGVEWFGATEAASAIGFNKPHDAVSNHVDEDDSAVYGVIDSLGRNQSKKHINESGLYSLIFGAAKQGNNPEIKEKAKSFKRWVTSEVLPTVRKTGSYSLQDQMPKTMPEALRLYAAQIEETERERAEKLQLVSQIEEDKPKVQFAETCMTSDRSILVREVAKLASKQGVMIGERRLFQKLREWGMFTLHYNEPTQRAMEMGLFELKKGVYAHPDGARDYTTPKVTVKGQMYIINRLRKEAA